MRRASSTSSASQMYSGGPSSPACATPGRPICRACAKTRANFGGRVADLGRVEADRRQVMGEGPGLLQRLQRRLLAAGRGGSTGSGPTRCRAPPCRRRGRGGSPCSRSRRRRRARCASAGRRRSRRGARPAGRLGQIGQREVVEVLLGAQHRAVGVVDVEERLQVLEDIGAAEGVHVGVGQRHPVAPPARTPARARACPQCARGARPWGAAEERSPTRSPCPLDALAFDGARLGRAVSAP